VRVLTGREVVAGLDVQERQLQSLYASFEQQRVSVEGHLSIIKLHNESLEGVRDKTTINGVYKGAGAAIEEILAMQRTLKLDTFEDLSDDYRVKTPGMKRKPVAEKQFWQTLDLFPKSSDTS